MGTNMQRRGATLFERAKQLQSNAYAIGVALDWGEAVHRATLEAQEARLAAPPGAPAPAGGGAPTLSECIECAEKAAAMAANHPELWKAATEAVAKAGVATKPKGDEADPEMDEPDEKKLARVGVDIVGVHGPNLLTRIMRALEKDEPEYNARHARACSTLAAARHASRVELLAGRKGAA